MFQQTSLLLPQNEFQHLLQYERIRADRSGQGFTLIAITPCSQAPTFSSVLTKVLSRRLRELDSVGHLDDGRLGILLPQTSATGAKSLLRDLATLLPSDMTPIEFELIDYHESDVQQPRGGTPSTELPFPGSPIEQPTGINSMQRLVVRPMPWWKRSMDIFGALLGLLLFSPLFLAIAIAVKLMSKGPIVFRQDRMGRAGKPFKMLKFRTMVADAEEQKMALLSQNEVDGPAFKIENDPRLTRLGRWLRKASLDELPQLWNVLIGDMSLVGPRPLPCEEAAQCHGWRQTRFDVAPGMTCIWQVSGRIHVPFDEWMRMDLRYIRQQTFLGDCKLILLTLPAVLLGHGAQ